MDFYIDGGGGGGSTGGLPTGWGAGSPGVGGGGGGVPTQSLDSYRSLLGSDTVNAYYSSMSNPDVMAAQKEHLNSLANSVMSLSRTRDFGAYNKAMAEFMTMAYNPYSYKPDNLVVDPKQMGFSAVKPTGDEEALLAEYGRGYSGPAYNADIYKGKYSNSEYNTWLDSQKKQYDAAVQGLAEYNNNKSLAPPGPWLSQGPPDPNDVLNAELMKLYNIDGHLGTYEPGLLPYNPLQSDWNGKFDSSGLLNSLIQGLFSADKVPDAVLNKSPNFVSSGLLAQSLAGDNKSESNLSSQKLPWQSKNLIKPASYFDDSSQGIAPPKGLMGQDMITQNNVLPALQMALMNSQSMPEGNEALDAATKPLIDAKDKGNATDKIQEARNKWKSDSLNKFGNWQSLA